MEKKPFRFLMPLFLAGLIFVSACEEEVVPPEENEEEVVTDVTLTFTPTLGQPVVVTATDPDGEGPQDLQVNEDIVLKANTEYVLNIELENKIAGEDLTEEVKGEADEHLFFFGWTEGLFSDPSGDGNIDNRNDPVDYMDFDNEQRPLGLETSWTSGEAGTGTFRVILKHQPEIKSESSSALDGETDLDISWDVKIE